MAKILIGIFMIALGMIQLSGLANRKSWLMWTNWWARGYRRSLGDAGYATYAKVTTYLLIGCGIFFILDEVLSLGILSAD